MADLSATDGTRINYEVHGRSGQWLIFVHGWCSNLRHWDAQVANFEGRQRILTLDRPGHGRSEPRPDDQSVAHQAVLLGEVAEAVGVTDAIVVGHAGGGPVTLELARSRPDLVAGAVLVDSRIGAGGGRALTTLANQLSGPGGDAEFRVIYSGFFKLPESEIAAEAVRGAVAMPREVAVADLLSLDMDSVAIASAVAQPVLWLSVEPADRQALRAVFADVRFGLIPESGHFPNLEAPDQTNALIEEFLTELGSAADPR
jgi:pimeloyl-ACP methyl ester carboxylesterase